jgi:hypothetical protein
LNAQITQGGTPKQHKFLYPAADAIRKGSNDIGIAIVGLIVATFDLSLIKNIGYPGPESPAYEHR